MVARLKDLFWQIRRCLSGVFAPQQKPLPFGCQRNSSHGQVGSELAKVNGLTAKAEVSLHELSSSTDIEKVGVVVGLKGRRLGSKGVKGMKGMKGVLVEDFVFWVIFGGMVTGVCVVDCWYANVFVFWNRRSEEKARLVCIASLASIVDDSPVEVAFLPVLFADCANSGMVS